MAENVNARGNKFCLNHLKEAVKFICEDCNEKACDSCVSTRHKGHNLIGIKLVVQEKYKHLQDLTTDIQESKIPRIQKIFKAAENSVKRVTDGIRTNIETAEEHGQYLKGLIDKSTAEKISELKDIEQQITNQLDTFKSECDDIIKRLEDLMKESKEVTKSDNYVLIIDVEEHMSSLTIEDPSFESNCQPASFVIGKKSESYIKEALGTIVYEQSSIPIATCADILTEPVISKVLDLSETPRSIQRMQQGDLWIVVENSKEVICIDTEQRSKKKLKLDISIRDLCQDLTTDELHCITNTDIGTLNIKSGKYTKLFDIVSFTHIKVTSNGSNFVVGGYDKPEIRLYSKRGTLLNSTHTVENTLNIAVCRSTGRVAIACGDGGVVVFESKENKLQHMYTYPSTGGSMYVRDAEFDAAGLILIPDYTHNEIHIANAETGHNLRTIIMDAPLFLTVQKNGDIAVVSVQETKKLLRKSKTEFQLMTVKYFA